MDSTRHRHWAGWIASASAIGREILGPLSYYDRSKAPGGKLGKLRKTSAVKATRRDGPPINNRSAANLQQQKPYIPCFGLCGTKSAKRGYIDSPPASTTNLSTTPCPGCEKFLPKHQQNLGVVYTVAVVTVADEEPQEMPLLLYYYSMIRFCTALCKQANQSVSQWVNRSIRRFAKSENRKIGKSVNQSICQKSAEL